MSAARKAGMEGRAAGPGEAVSRRLRALRDPSWVVIRFGHQLRWGGERRRLRLFADLAERTDARVIDGGAVAPLTRVLRRRGVRSRVLRVVRPRSRIASSEALPLKVLSTAKELGQPMAVAVYDDPVAQAAALGLPHTPEHSARLVEQRLANLDAFRLHVVPTASFAELLGLDVSRVVVGRNGTDTDYVRPEPWPERPAIGYVSGAAPGRGIEELIGATRMVRDAVPDAELRLWLVATGENSRLYLEALIQSVARDPWVKLDTVAYPELSQALGRATVMCIPHPKNEYLEVALPVKLLDMMAAGRPVVVTPRREMVAIVRRTGCGVVAAGERAEDLAAGLLTLLEDQAEAQRLGAAGRLAAVSEYDWAVVGRRVADEVLDRAQ